MKRPGARYMFPLIASAMLCPVTAGGTALTTERVASGLELPVFATFAPGDFTRSFIIEKRGLIRILNLKTGVVNAASFLDIDSLVTGGTSPFSEQGLLGLTFHPDYQDNGYFYVNYTDDFGATQVVRYTRSTPDLADPSSATTILAIDQPFPNHNGGWLAFGPDGLLYIATGDGGNVCDPSERAQDITDQLLGKLLRLDVDGGSPYAIPPGNPFVGITGDDEIWAYGLRNPWRPSFDRATGDLYIADVGQNAWEEVSFQPAASTGGENYGWDCEEGFHCSPCATVGCACGAAGLIDPIHEYSHGVGCSITGGYVYRGCAVPDLAGTYFFADFCTARIWSFEGAGAANFQDRTAELSPSLGGHIVDQISSFGEDARGEVYIVDQGDGPDGQIFRIRADAYALPFADVDCNRVVNVADMLAVLADWGPCDGCASDITGDHVVNVFDLLAVLAHWGPIAP